MGRTAISGIVAAAAALAIMLSGCGSDTKTEPSTSASASTTTSSETSTKAAAPATKSKIAPRDEDAAGPNPTIASYIADNNIQETPVKMGDPWRTQDRSARPRWLGARRREHP
jgi:hypothetical protein